MYFSCTQLLLIQSFSCTQVFLKHTSNLPQQVLCWLRPISLVIGRGLGYVRPGVGPGLLQNYNLLVPRCVQKGGNFTHQPVHVFYVHGQMSGHISHNFEVCLVLTPGFCHAIAGFIQKENFPYLRNFVITIPVHPGAATVSRSLSTVLPSDDHCRPPLGARQFGPHQTPTLHCGLQHLQATSIKEPDRGRLHTAVCIPRPPGSTTQISTESTISVPGKDWTKTDGWCSWNVCSFPFKLSAYIIC